MKKNILVILIIVFLIFVFVFLFKGSYSIWEKMPGVSDYPSMPLSSKFSEENGLLLSKYKPNQFKVMINGETYLVEDAWTTYSFKSRFSNQINKNSYEFLVLIKNTETGEYCKSKYKGVFPDEHVVYHGKKYGYTNNIGVINHFLSIDFITKNKPISPDTIKFEFKNFDKSCIVSFAKE